MRRDAVGRRLLRVLVLVFILSHLLRFYIECLMNYCLRQAQHVLVKVILCLKIGLALRTKMGFTCLSVCLCVCVLD